jgi:succinoglycan biosynthesis protein ExoM
VGLVGRAMFRGLEGRRRQLARKARKRIEEGSEDKIMIATNNWLLDLRWARRTGLRFDEGLRYTGGSDSVFFWTARRMGIKSGWCERAVVYETVPAERLTYGYQCGRAIDQAINAQRRRYPKLGARALARIVASAGWKLVMGSLALLAAPVTGGRTLLASARWIGGGLGRIRAVLGGRSDLYKRG